jgi:photosystem II stability/assembly factor-like uncharacterized protein
MDILSYPVGLLIGLFPVIVDLGGRPEPAELLLDGRTACSISARAPACTVDLGPDPVLHLLELVRRDKAGHVTESVRRWINKPGVEAEVRALGRCERKTKSCDFTITWAHPGKLDPSSLTVALDGVTVSRDVASAVRIPFPRGSTPQVITADATFPDGRRATFTHLLQGSYPERAEASLQAIPIVVQPGVRDEDLADLLRGAGWPVRAVEQGEFELVFVVEPGAFGSSTNVGTTALRSRSSMPLEDAEQIRVIVANDSLTAFDALQEASTPARQLPGAGTGQPTGIDKWPLDAVPRTRPRRGGQESWLRRLFLAPLNAPALRRLRTSDAVAVAGYDLGGSSRRRAVVLIAGSERTDESTFSPDQARTYLGQTLVPLFVWRATAGSASDWPAGSALRALGPDMAELRRDLDHQRIVWLEGRVDPRQFDPKLPPGIAIAGRDTTARTPPAPEIPRPADSPAVFTVAIDPESSQTIYAGTRKGLQASRDGGDHWSPLRTGAEPGEVYSVALHSGGGEIFFGSSGAIGHSIGGGESWALAPTLAVFSILLDSKDPKLALAATRGGVFRTTDGGSRWIPSDAGMEKTFALSLAADARDPGVFFAATAGSGVFKSTDAGQSWRLTGRELDRTVVRCVATGPASGHSVYAGTDGGVFVSADRGASWQRRGSGLPRAVVYALLLDPADPSRIFAGTAAGLFESRDGAKVWNRLSGSDPYIQVTSLALDAPSGRLYAGTLGRGVVALSVQ